MKIKEETPIERLNNFIQVSDKAGAFKAEDVSDGYHTFRELYDHRIALFITLSNFLYRDGHSVWKSKKHSDGTSWDDWFIAGLCKDAGEQISYHLPIKMWDALVVEELDKAPEFDGHTPADVIERLLRL